MKRFVLICALLAAACAPDDSVTLYVTSADEALLRDGVGFINDPRLKLVVVANPMAKLGTSRNAMEIALTSDARCAECYRLDGRGRQLWVTGGGALGRQYGVWHALELLGYRFTHPYYTHLPETISPVATQGHDYAPQIEKRRGLHLHTLHPTEQYQDFWEPSEVHLDGARRTVDFLVKNRGNYLQWFALDNIDTDPSQLPGWQQHTRAITSYAHAHGVQTGIGFQLFGASNLQLAFDLIDDDTGDVVPEMERRLHVLLDGNGFDVLNISFGEFFGAGPDAFVARVNDAYDAMQRVQPNSEVTATIHVGNYENLQVTFMGETLQYYFLVKFANAAIVPWVHTTMYYDLYEDAGGAYGYDGPFDTHRLYLEQKLAAGAPAGYFPESAYWVAFDINVPTLNPLYIRSRHLDLQRLTGLQDHVLFSSGWEWGYWLNDAATLRMTYSRSDAWDDVVKDIYGGWGEKGAKAASIISRMGESQHRALILERLAAYLAGRDAIIDAGDVMGIFSQPDRPEFSEIVAMTPEARADFKARVVEKLKVYADELTALSAEAQALDAAGDPVLVELQESLAVTASRARFAYDVFGAAVAFADGEDATSLLTAASAEFDASLAITQGHRRKYWHPSPLSLVATTQNNATFYDYGYLREADTLCFWKRELYQARNVIKGEGNLIPSCVL